MTSRVCLCLMVALSCCPLPMARAEGPPWETPLAAKPAELLAAADKVKPPENAHIQLLHFAEEMQFADDGAMRHTRYIAMRVLTPAGLYISNVGRMGWLFKTGLTSIVSKQVKMMPTQRPKLKDLTALRAFLEAGTIVPVIDRVYALSEVPDALRQQGEGHAQGKKVITV